MLCALLDQSTWPALQWIEVRTAFKIPELRIIGLPGRAVSEARERVRSALESSGFEFPRRRVVINLAPAQTAKVSTGVDLAMALAIAYPNLLEPCAAWGELSLKGDIRPAGQLLRLMVACVENRVPRLVLPTQQRAEAAQAATWILDLMPQSHHLRVVWVDSLRDALARLRDGSPGLPLSTLLTSKSPAQSQDRGSEDWGELPLSPGLIRILLAAVVGRHHLLLVGPRGTGKSHALKAALSWVPRPPASLLLRDLVYQAYAEADSAHLTEKLYKGTASIAREVASDVTRAALLGGRHRVGELTRAHGGTLIAHEFLEWHRDARECLREPLETHQVLCARAQSTVTQPADFCLWATSNPCPCGEALCRCSTPDRRRYLNRLSGPVLDRFDLSYWVDADSERVAYQVADLKSTAHAARALLLDAWGCLPGRLPTTTVDRLRHLPGQVAGGLRERHTIGRVALSLAALDGEVRPKPYHFDEALSYRLRIGDPTPDVEHSDLRGGPRHPGPDDAPQSPEGPQIQLLPAPPKRSFH